MVRPPTTDHRAVWEGTPATSAYAITCGMRYAVTVTPASTSPRSQVRWYPVTQAGPHRGIRTAFMA